MIAKWNFRKLGSSSLSYSAVKPSAAFSLVDGCELWPSLWREITNLVDLWRLIFGVLISLILVGPANATEEDSLAAYQAYQAAQHSGDSRAALEHITLAHAEAVTLWGVGTPETLQFVAALARTQNDLLQFEEAVETVLPVIHSSIDFTEWPQYFFESYFEIGRATRGLNQFQQSQTHFTRALLIAESSYPANGLRVAYAHMELARSHVDRHNITVDAEMRGGVFGSGYAQVAGSSASFEQASEFFNSSSSFTIEQEIIETIEAGNLMADGNMDEAGEVLEPAIQAMVDQGYMDDYALGLYIDWISSHSDDWSWVRMDRFLRHAIEYGQLRQEGRYIPIVRIYGFGHTPPCDDPSNENYLSLEFSVDASGEVPRTRVVESNLPSFWEPDVRRTMRRWVFVPAQSNGQPTRVDNIRYHVDVRSGRSC